MTTGQGSERDPDHCRNTMIINFMNNCLRLKDKMIHNQANKYKVGEGNPQKNTKSTKSVSMKALKQEEPTIPHRDSKWLSKKSDPRRNDKKDSANGRTQQPVGLKKNLNEYIFLNYVRKSLRVTAIYCVHFHWSYLHFVKYHMKFLWSMNQSSLSIDCLSTQKCSTLN